MAKHDHKNTLNERRHDVPRLFHDRRRRRVGLVGGSFNPAHAGHLHMALLARQRLQLDDIWFLVSPQNPLKPTTGMAPLASRIQSARKIAIGYNFIKVMSPETNFRSVHTFKTLKLIKQMAPNMQFMWIMGADNLGQFFAWEQWQRIKYAMPIAVIDRPSYSYTAISAGRKLGSRRMSSEQLAKRGKNQNPKLPIWCFIAGRRHHASATALRALQGDH